MIKGKKSRKQTAISEKPDNNRLVDRRSALAVFGGIVVAAAGLYAGFGLFGSKPAKAMEVIVFKDPSCECCGRWIDHMGRAGFTVSVRNLDNVYPIKTGAGVPEDMYSCHTAVVDGYVIEGHVPAMDVLDILAERPDIRGLAVPGMPSSAPGMDSPDNEPYTVFSFDVSGAIRPYASY